MVHALQDCVKLRDWGDNIAQHKSVAATCISPKPVRTGKRRNAASYTLYFLLQSRVSAHRSVVATCVSPKPVRASHAGMALIASPPAVQNFFVCTVGSLHSSRWRIRLQLPKLSAVKAVCHALQPLNSLLFGAQEMDYGQYLRWVYERYAMGDAMSTSAADYR